MIVHVARSIHSTWRRKNLNGLKLSC